jgi:hypothetical protein
MMIHDTERGTRAIYVRFADAAEVYLVGAFNNWSTLATRLVRVGDSLWKGTVPRAADLHGLGFFVFQNGQSFGRFFREDQMSAAEAVGAAIPSRSSEAVITG